MADKGSSKKKSDPPALPKLRGDEVGKSTKKVDESQGQKDGGLDARAKAGIVFKAHGTHMPDLPSTMSLPKQKKRKPKPKVEPAPPPEPSPPPQQVQQAPPTPAPKVEPTPEPLPTKAPKVQQKPPQFVPEVEVSPLPVVEKKRVTFPKSEPEEPITMALPLPPPPPSQPAKPEIMNLAQLSVPQPEKPPSPPRVEIPPPSPPRSPTNNLTPTESFLIPHKIGSVASSIASSERTLRPNPSVRFDSDLEDEIANQLSDDYRTINRKSVAFGTELTLDDRRTNPDDELLFSLTAKEEIVFRRGIADMRWEEEMSTPTTTDVSSTDETSDSERVAAAILWERVGQRKKFEIPIILVNDRRISLSHLDPSPLQSPTQSNEDVNSVLQKAFADNGSSDSDDEKAQKLFEFLDDAEAMRKKEQTEEERRAADRGKLWRRRLLVVMILQLLMKSRRLFILFCELITPILFSGVIISGMTYATNVHHQSIIPSRDPGFDPFDTMTAETLMTSVCSNVDCSVDGVVRHFFIVYSPSNNFTDDLMIRALRLMKLGQESRVEEFKVKSTKAKRKKPRAHSDISRLIGVNTAQEVQTICTNHWHSHTEEQPKSQDTADLSEVDEADTVEQGTGIFDVHDLLRYPFGIVFTMEENLVGRNRMKRISEDLDVPTNLQYTIRTFYPEIANTVEGFPFREQRAKGSRFSESRLTSYGIHTGFIGLQMALDFAFAEKIVEKAEKEDPFVQIGETKLNRRAFYNEFLTEPALKQFEYPTYHGESARTRVWLCVTLGIAFSYLVIDVYTAQETVLEQNKGSSEILKIHGMTTSMRWLANMAIVIILRALPTLAMALIIHFNLSDELVSENTHVVALWGFLWMHACTCTFFNLFIISIFIVKKAELAGVLVACVNTLTLLIPLLLFVEFGTRFPRFVNLFLCFFFPQWNLANGIYFYLRFELYEEGLDWYDFPVVLDEQNHKVIALPLCCIMFLYTTLFYMLLTIYLDHILPREFSPRESWLFFLKSFTRQHPAKAKVTRPIPRSQKPSVYELGPKDAVYGPRFRSLTVNDSNNKLVVLDNISMDIYEGEVTCIVGQIGSGKSDFLNVIAGVNVPSSGFVDVKGYRVHEYHDLTNRHVSLCPQKRLLIETLSVEEHIIMCCMLHGTSYAKAKHQASFLLKMFGLMSMRRHSYTGLTTNDTKKLMLAMALSKSPSVLLMDNPVDELDADSRLQFWKLLQELKPMRSIVVTCTTLEEAQLYADRIAILSKGKLVCYGSPYFLRMAYGIGNVMTLRMNQGHQPDIPALEETMHAELHGARTILLDTKGVSMQADTVKFIMPFGKFYGGLLEKLEDEMESFGISKIHMAPPSLWALFEKIASSPGIEQSIAKREIRMLRGGRGDDGIEHEGLENAVEAPIPFLSEEPHHSCLNIFKALFLKKWWYYTQKYSFFMVAYVPQILMIATMALTSHLFLFDEPESLSKIVSSNMYTNQTILFRSMDNDHTRPGWAEAFKRIVAEDDKMTTVKVLKNDTDLEALLEQGSNHTLTQLKQQSIVAFSKDKDGFLGYYSSNSIHSAAIASHLLMQAFLYVLSPDRNKTYATKVVTHPFLQYEGFPVGSIQSVSKTILGIYLSIILCLLSTPMLRMILMERTTNFKAVQRLTGVSSSLYWLSHGFADLLLYSVLTFLSCAVIIILDRIWRRQLDGNDEILALIIVMSSWLCWSSVPCTYLLGMWLPKKGVGYGHYLLLHFLLGVIPKLVSYQFLRLQTGQLFFMLRCLFYIFPQYSLTSACVHYFQIVGDDHWCSSLDESETGPCEMYRTARELFENGTLTELDGEDSDESLVSENAASFISDQIIFNDTFRTCCKAYCNDAGTCQRGFKFSTWPESHTIPLLQHDCVALLLNGLGFWILLILYEKKAIQKLLSYLLRKVCGNLERTVAQKDTKPTDEPEDVKKEHQNVDYMVEIEGDVDSEVYLVQDVTKFYPYVKGLDHIYFSVPVNSVTGLLGLPKSGKSTILAMLTGQVSPSAGYVYKDNDLLDGHSVKRLMSDVGFCPQRSCLLTYLTGAQMLTVMGRLRGLSRRECQQHVLWWMELFELKEVANTKCAQYRKGQERRLCCAIALIGDTKTAIFDEPTASMDNFERYIFWNIISRIHNTTPRTVLFASINAEEVQNQSSKALLMESGSLVAVGQLNEIFKNNNHGLTLAIRYGIPSYKEYTELQKRVKIDKLKDHVIQFLSPAALMDEQESILIYHLKDQNLKLSRVFAVMEGAKVSFSTMVKDFQVYEPSLDDIILQFHKARVRRHEEEVLKEEKEKR